MTRPIRPLVPLAILGLLLLAGCLGGGRAPDEGPPRQFPVDIDAPAPADPPFDVELLEPPDPLAPFSLSGRVLDAAGQPLHGASVWIEGANLRDPVNNVATYQRIRDATMTRVGPDGAFGFHLRGGFYHVIAAAPGHLPHRLAPEIPDEGGLDVELILRPLEGTLVAAHRGASFYAPENTISSMHKAILLGAHYVEIDVQLTADDEIVLMHDHTLDRTTSGTGYVRAHTLAQLSRLEAGAWFHESFGGEGVATLNQALAFAHARGAVVIIDIKALPEWERLTERRVFETVRNAGMQETALIATFRIGGVQACAAEGDLRCALISRGPGDGADNVNLTYLLGAEALLLRHNLVDQAAVDQARTLGISLLAWTINEPDGWERMIGRGVDAIITDLPGFLLDHLATR